MFSGGNKGSVLSVFSRWHRLGGVTKADIGESQVDRTQPEALQGVALLYKTCFGITPQVFIHHSSSTLPKFTQSCFYQIVLMPGCCAVGLLKIDLKSSSDPLKQNI